ncbi:hypothetical protein Y032_0670g1375 [Ancylostoma ceylanicum]|uniref:Uncharacterized protein n=1 Tax=Ancylostoma ceylanicum TaxID=53326 RepID=A0A016WIT1_9BILA|nr:hypothetical protein Y032_0670g1375 [Ancylostoma ceylanicum]
MSYEKNGKICPAWDQVHNRSNAVPICAKACVSHVTVHSKSALSQKFKDATTMLLRGTHEIRQDCFLSLIEM